jgi:DNA polymerase alpha subunit A
VKTRPRSSVLQREHGRAVSLQQATRRSGADRTGNIDDPTPTDKLASSLNTIVRPIEKFPPNLEARAKTDRSPFQTVKAERALLNSLLATIQRNDPDVIVGHSFLGNSFEALLYRLKELKADHWSRIGRFRRKGFNISKAGSNVRLLAGRLVADLSSDAAKVSPSQ